MDKDLNALDKEVRDFVTAHNVALSCRACCFGWAVVASNNSGLVGNGAANSLVVASAIACGIDTRIAQAA